MSETEGVPPEWEGMLQILSEEDTSFSFFQAMRLLQRLLPEKGRIGHFGDPQAEAVRIGVNPSLAFPAGEIQALEPSLDGPWSAKVNFLGLVGHMGVLPHHYTRLVLRRLQERDPALAAFLDLFHHRLASLFYRAWELTHPFVAHERGEAGFETDRLYDLIGLGGDRLRKLLGFEPEALLFYVALLGPRRRSAEALEQLVEVFFGVPVDVEQFVGGWNTIESANRCRLDEDSTGPHVSLGSGAVVGDEVWDPQARVRLVVGPVGRDVYEELLPTGVAYPVLQELARFFVDDEIDLEVRIILAANEVPGVELGAEEDATLGWCSWLRSETADRDGDETVLTL